MKRFANETLSRRELVLKDHEVNVLGPRLVLEECTVVSECGHRALVVAELTMRGGSFQQRRRSLTNYQFDNAHFDGVRFVGRFVGCDFGDWDTTVKASIARCTFEEATLDACRFLNCDAGNIVFPAWPCFVVHDPSRAREYVESQQWPIELGLVLNVITRNESACVASCLDARRVEKNDGLPLDAIRATLRDIPGLAIRDR